MSKLSGNRELERGVLYCTVRWSNHTTNMNQCLTSSYAGEKYTDVVIACDGHLIKAHKIILAGCSSYFENLFSAYETKVQNGQSMCVTLDGMGIAYPTLQLILEFMYSGEIRVKKTELESLVRGGVKLKVKGLDAVKLSDKPLADEGRPTSQPEGRTQQPPTVIQPPMKLPGRAPRRNAEKTAAQKSHARKPASLPMATPPKIEPPDTPQESNAPCPGGASPAKRVVSPVNRTPSPLKLAVSPAKPSSSPVRSSVSPVKHPSPPVKHQSSPVKHPSSPTNPGEEPMKTQLADKTNDDAPAPKIDSHPKDVVELAGSKQQSSSPARSTDSSLSESSGKPSRKRNPASGKRTPIALRRLQTDANFDSIPANITGIDTAKKSPGEERCDTSAEPLDAPADNLPEGIIRLPEDSSPSLSVDTVSNNADQMELPPKSEGEAEPEPEPVSKRRVIKKPARLADLDFIQEIKIPPAKKRRPQSLPIKPSVEESAETPAEDVPPEPVKRKKGVFFIFCQDFREKVHAENPGESHSEITKRLSTIWKNLDPAEKEKYFKQLNS